MHTRKEWNKGRLKVVYSHRTKDEFMGRFGGGWNWKVGMQFGGGTMILSLLVADLIVSYRRAAE